MISSALVLDSRWGQPRAPGRRALWRVPASATRRRGQTRPHSRSSVVRRVRALRRRGNRGQRRRSPFPGGSWRAGPMPSRTGLRVRPGCHPPKTATFPVRHRSPTSKWSYEKVDVLASFTKTCLTATRCCPGTASTAPWHRRVEYLSLQHKNRPRVAGQGGRILGLTPPRKSFLGHRPDRPAEPDEAQGQSRVAQVAVVRAPYIEARTVSKFPSGMASDGTAGRPGPNGGSSRSAAGAAAARRPARRRWARGTPCPPPGRGRLRRAGRRSPGPHRRVACARPSGGRARRRGRWRLPRWTLPPLRWPGTWCWPRRPLVHHRPERPRLAVDLDPVALARVALHGQRMPQRERAGDGNLRPHSWHGRVTAHR